MKALLLYVFFVAVGAIAAFVGSFAERTISSSASTFVFLLLFFTNLVTSWIAVILVMDGSLRNMQGLLEQLKAEREGRLRDSRG